MILLNGFRRVLSIATVIIILNPLFGISSALSQDQSSSGSGVREPDRPKFNFLRFQEDWSMFKNIPASQRKDTYDSIKYIPLTADYKFNRHLVGLRQSNF